MPQYKCAFELPCSPGMANDDGATFEFLEAVFALKHALSASAWLVEADTNGPIKIASPTETGTFRTIDRPLPPRWLASYARSSKAVPITGPSSKGGARNYLSHRC
jgi:hypothetical protein